MLSANCSENVVAANAWYAPDVGIDNVLQSTIDITIFELHELDKIVCHWN